MKPKHIVLSGYYGFDNAGDEAVCASIMQALRRKDAKLTFTILSGNPEKTQQEHGVDAVDRTNLKEIQRVFKSADLLISGGGSLLQDKTGPLTIPYYLGIIHLARWMKLPVAIYAQGIGPVNRKFFQMWVRSLFKKLDYISVRDPESREMLMRWKVPEELVEEVVDPVLLLESKGKEEGERILRKEGISFTKPPILVSVRHWHEGQGDIEQIAEVCDRLIEQGEEILFLPMHHPEDVKASVEVVASMKQPAKVLEGAYTPSQLMDIVSLGKLMVGMRLHALIFAAAREIPIAGISYDPKIDAFTRLLGQEAAAISGQITPDPLYSHISTMLEKEVEVKKRLRDRIKALRTKAALPAEQVIRLLRKQKN